MILTDFPCSPACRMGLAKDAIIDNLSRAILYLELTRTSAFLPLSHEICVNDAVPVRRKILCQPREDAILGALTAYHPLRHRNIVSRPRLRASLAPNI